MTDDLTFTAGLLSLKDGWYDGDGRAPSVHVLRRLEQVTRLLFGDLDGVRAYPTVDGGATAEQQQAAVHRSVEVGPDLQAAVVAVDITAEGPAVSCVLQEAGHA